AHITEARGRGHTGTDNTPQCRPQNPPQQSTKLAAIGLQSRTAPFGVKVVLIPKPVLLLRRRRFGRAGNIVDVVAVGGDQAEYALRPECSDDAGGAPAPVVTGEHAAFDRGPVLEVVAQRRLLA